MPRYSLPKLTSITQGSFEPNRKNPISLRNDENLDDNLKSLKIGENIAPLELAAEKVRFSGNLLVGRCKFEGDINVADGDFNLNEGAKLRFDNDITTELSPITSGNSYINVESDVMYFYVGGEKLLTIGQNFGFGTTDKITTFTSNLSIDEGQKLYFEGMDSDSYLTRTSSDNLEYYGDGTKLFTVSDAGVFTLHENGLSAPSIAATTMGELHLFRGVM